MNTLAGILAGQGGNPYQTNQGISPLLSQFLLNQQMAPGQLGGQPPGGNPMPPGGNPMSQMPQQAPYGIGSMGAAANPQLAALLQAQNGSGQY